MAKHQQLFLQRAGVSMALPRKAWVPKAMWVTSGIHTHHCSLYCCKGKGKFHEMRGLLLKMVCWDNSYKVHMVHIFCAFVKNMIKFYFFRESEFFTNSSQT